MKAPERLFVEVCEDGIFAFPEPPFEESVEYIRTDLVPICPKQNDTESWNEDYNEEDLQTRFAFYTYKNEPGVLYLSNLFVEEASRNRGLGSKILKAAEKVAETIGASSIGLRVKQDSPANAWYRKNGYGYVTSEDGYDWLEKTLKLEEGIYDERLLRGCRLFPACLSCGAYCYGKRLHEKEILGYDRGEETKKIIERIKNARKEE